mmetsp:Transcript_136794/g.381323  ORF Transcript_136794/g.381323 Transcript_136794/m.381323 type:complete len:345 (-) Transcript_136794:632-1666(-)
MIRRCRTRRPSRSAQARALQHQARPWPRWPCQARRRRRRRRRVPARAPRAVRMPRPAPPRRAARAPAPLRKGSPPRASTLQSTFRKRWRRPRDAAGAPAGPPPRRPSRRAAPPRRPCAPQGPGLSPRPRPAAVRLHAAAPPSLLSRMLPATRLLRAQPALAPAAGAALRAVPGGPAAQPPVPWHGHLLLSLVRAAPPTLSSVRQPHCVPPPMPPQQQRPHCAIVRPRPQAERQLVAPRPRRPSPPPHPRHSSAPPARSRPSRVAGPRGLPATRPPPPPPQWRRRLPAWRPAWPWQPPPGRRPPRPRCAAVPRGRRPAPPAARALAPPSGRRAAPPTVAASACAA